MKKLLVLLITIGVVTGFAQAMTQKAPKMVGASQSVSQQPSAKPFSKMSRAEGKIGKGEEGRGSVKDRLAALEKQVAMLREEVEGLKKHHM